MVLCFPELCTTEPELMKGDTGSCVGWVQQRLRELGYDIGPTGVDCEFGDYTEMAVKKFQQDRGLVPDGIVGPKTWAELKKKSWWEKLSTWEKAAIIGGGVLALGIILWFTMVRSTAEAIAPKVTVVTGSRGETE